MKILRLLILIILSLAFVNCGFQKAISNREKSSDLFLKWLLESIDEKMVSKKSIQLSMETLWRMREDIKFSKKDFLTMKKQIEINNKTIFDSSLSLNKTFIEKIEYNYTYLKVSNPIFFDNGKKLWVNVEKYCPDTCGMGFIEIYEVSKSGYKLLFKIRTWIS